MSNKKIFIIAGVVVVLLIIGYFIFNKNESLTTEENEIKTIIYKNRPKFNQLLNFEINQENTEEAQVLFLELEEAFYSILENIFLMGEDRTKLVLEEIVEIENNLKIVKAGLEDETINSAELNRRLSVIQIKLQLLVEKLIEIDS